MRVICGTMGGMSLNDMIPVGLLPSGGGGGGGWTLVAHAAANNQAASGAGSYSTPSRVTTGATLLVVALAQYNGVQNTTISDSMGNTWTALSTYNTGAGNGSITLWYCLSPVVGSGHQVITTPHPTTATNDFSAVAFAAFSGGGSALDQTSGAGSASTLTQQPGSVTPTAAGELLITGLCFAATTGTATVDSGYTVTDVYLDTTGTVFNVALAFLSQGSAAPSNPTWTKNDAAGRMAAAIATFKV